jgi:type II secretory pathway component PulC
MLKKWKKSLPYFAWAFVLAACSSTPHHVKASGQTSLNELLSTARLGPYPSQEKKEAYVVTNIELGSAWEKIGLEEGDVILKVDGKSVVDSRAYLDLFRAVSQPGAAPIEILRQGEFFILPVAENQKR